MHIVQIIPELAAGGAERTTLDIGKAVLDAGGKSLVLSKGGRLVAELLASGSLFQPMSAHSKNPLKMWNNIAEIAKFSRDFGGQIIHARSRAPAWSASFAARRLGIPFVTTYHGTYNSNSGLKTWYNSIMASGDLVIANSKFVADHISQTHEIDMGKIRVIPRGIDLAGFNPANIEKSRLEQARQTLIVPSETDKPLILMPGRLTRWKGQLVMIEALGLLRDRGLRAHLLLPGDAQGRDRYVRELEAKIIQLDLQQQVNLPGHVTDMAALYAISQIVVSASIEPEAFGRVAVEGQAAGKPVIATAHGGSLETIQQGISGLLVFHDNPTAMADALMQILSLSNQQQQQWGSRGQSWVTGQFSRTKMCRLTLAVYQELLAQAG